jgi:hypothetical protein
VPPAFMLVSRLAYSLTLSMEVTCSSETSIDFIPDDRTLQNRRCENLKSYRKPSRSQNMLEMVPTVVL